MKRIWKIVAVCLLGSGLMWAEPAQCKQGTLANYISLGAEGCTFAGIVFANFEYSASAKGGAPVIKADKVKVDPLLIPTATASFRFSAPWNVNSAQSQDSVIKYTAVLPSGDATPAVLGLVLGSSHVGSIASVDVRESTNVGKLDVSDRCTELFCRTNAHDSFQFNPVSVVLITTDVSLIGGLGGASLSEFDGQLNWCGPCL